MGELKITGLPSWGEVSRAISLWASDVEWSGVPLPVQGLSLVLEDRNPWKDRIEVLQGVIDDGYVDPEPDVLGLTLINSWWSHSQQCTVSIMEHNGVRAAVRHGHAMGRKALLAIKTMEATTAWSLEAEETALAQLRTLIKPHLYKSWTMTGTFIETSKRSQLCYMFRRCRPTLVLSPNNDNRELSVLCALCLHPIGYYEHTWAGSMTPTDEAIAHLLLMRGDEHLYWRRANQHPPTAPESGL